MSKLKGIVYLILMVFILSPSFISEADTKYTYSDWSAWQTTQIKASETMEVETRMTNITEQKTEYCYEYWRYWNSSANKYLYKGNSKMGGTHYSVTLPSKLKYYKDTSDGASYLVGSGKYLKFTGECWFNQKEVKTSKATGKKTEYRYRTKTKIESKTVEQPPTDTKTSTEDIEDSDESPGVISVLKSSKSEYSEKESIVIEWSRAANASEYGLTVRKSPYTGNNSMKYDNRIKGNSVNIGDLPAGNYRFAMRAYNSSGDSGPVSKIVYFTVSKSKAEEQQPILTLTQPVLKLDKEKYLSGERILISWDRSPDAASYTVYVKGENNPINALQSGILDTKHDIALMLPGKYKIWAASKNKTSSSSKTNEVSLIVSDVLISSPNLALVLGGTSQLSIKYADGNTDKSNPKWYSNNNEIAAVDSKGMITAKKIGDATISASIDGKKIDSCNVTVTKAKIILPVDINAGKWKASTYGGTAESVGGHWGTSFRAVDLNLPNNMDKGKPVRAIADGVVFEVIGKYGEVIIKHTDHFLTLSDGSRTYRTWYSLYAHMADINVKKGKTISQGDIIGKISNIAPRNKDEKPLPDHLHFAITTKLDNYSIVSKLEKYNYYTISPLWIGGDYENISYIPLTPDAFDGEAVARLSKSAIKLAPKSN